MLRSAAIELDRAANVMLGGTYPETLSARMGAALDRSRACCILCRFLNLFEQDHCKRSFYHYRKMAARARLDRMRARKPVTLP